MQRRTFLEDLRPAAAVVGVAAADGLGAPELFGEHGSDQQVGPGHGAETECHVGACGNAGIEAFGAADHEDDGAGVFEPGGEVGGEGFAGGAGAAEVEGDGAGVGG